MGKVLYPKATTYSAHVKKEAESPLHIVYSDPSNPDDVPVMRHYGSELVAKMAAWYHCKIIGFSKRAVLYTNEEVKQKELDG
jgi:hypothetical protein